MDKSRKGFATLASERKESRSLGALVPIQTGQTCPIRIRDLVAAATPQAVNNTRNTHGTSLKDLAKSTILAPQRNGS
jgi:hypothetical protein